MMSVDSHMTHFTGRGTEAQRGAQACLQSHTVEQQSQGSRLGSLCPPRLLSYPFPFLSSQRPTQRVSINTSKMPQEFLFCVMFVFYGILKTMQMWNEADVGLNPSPCLCALVQFLHLSNLSFLICKMGLIVCPSLCPTPPRLS